MLTVVLWLLLALVTGYFAFFGIWVMIVAFTEEDEEVKS